MAPPKAKFAHKRKTISLDVKQEILQRLDAGQKISQVSGAMNLAKSTVQTVRHNQSIIKEQLKHLNPNKTAGISRKQPPIMAKMESILSMWIDDNTTETRPISTVNLQEKAKSIFASLQAKTPDSKTTFNASSGWLTHFKKRYNLHNTKRKGVTTCRAVETQVEAPVEPQIKIQKEEVHSTKGKGATTSRAAAVETAIEAQIVQEEEVRIKSETQEETENKTEHTTGITIIHITKQKELPTSSRAVETSVEPQVVVKEKELVEVKCESQKEHKDETENITAIPITHNTKRKGVPTRRVVEAQVELPVEPQIKIQKEEVHNTKRKEVPTSSRAIKAPIESQIIAQKELVQVKCETQEEVEDKTTTIPINVLRITFDEMDRLKEKLREVTEIAKGIDTLLAPYKDILHGARRNT